MAKKLQIKLLSTHGELLNVVTCFAGQISVFRANSPSDLKPYQRALSGGAGPEKFAVSLDGRDYRPDEHNVIGFGEPLSSPQTTVRDYLALHGVSPDATDSLLLSYGLDTVATKRCSQLSADEERRLRLLGAVQLPSRVLVLNEPFEPISSQWRERFAELLLVFCKQKQGLVVITALSFRPESFIDNETVARIQVGETIQKTIGFGSAGSASNQLMSQFREFLKDESKVQEALAGTPSKPAESKPEVEMWDDKAAQVGISKSPNSGARNDAAAAKLLRVISARPKEAAVAGGVCVLILVLAIWSGAKTGQHSPEHTAALVEPAVTRPESGVQQPIVSKSVEPAVVEIETPEEPPRPASVLDNYPVFIRASLVESVNGRIIPEDSGAPAVQPQPVQKQNTLFSELESASTNQPDPPAPDVIQTEPDPGSYQSPPESSMDEDAKREAIRQKFLEAIRAAAERRRLAMAE